MVDFRAELAALVAAYNEHGGGWTQEGVNALWHAVEHARAVLAAAPQIEAPGWCETDAEQYAWQAGWEARDDAMLQPLLPVADGEVVGLPPRPPLMEPPAHLALERYGITWDGSPDKPLLTRMADGYWTPWHVAADLLERQAAAAPVARLPEDAQVIEPVNRIILAPVPTPIPVSERLPEKAEMTDDGEVWIEDPGGEYPVGDNDFDWEPHKWILGPITKYAICNNRRWLAADALPLPEVE